MPDLLLIALLVVGVIAGGAVLYMHNKHVTTMQLLANAQANPRGTLADVFDADRDFFVETLQHIQDKLSPKPFPGPGAAFVDLFDVGEQYGISGIKQGVVLDGTPVRSGVEPAIVLRTVDGMGISRIS